MNGIDTNIWIYSHDRRDPRKLTIAQRVIADPYVLIWQVGCEFIAASRKLAVIGFTEDDAWKALERMRAGASAILLPDPQLWPAAQVLQSRYSLSFWDALLVAACLHGGVQTLYTENLVLQR